MSFDKIFDLTAGVYFNLYNKYKYSVFRYLYGFLRVKPPTSGSDQQLFTFSQVESGRNRRCLKYHGLGQEGFGLSRVVSSRVMLVKSDL